MKNDIAFGPDGWLGTLGSDFTENNVVRVANALIRYLFQKSPSREKSKVAIGFDGRKNSKDYASLVATVLAGNNINVLLSSEVVPMPVFSFATKHHGCALGIMVTGGHNLPEHNGLAFKGAYGGPFTSEETAKVQALLIDSNEKPVRPASSPSKDITLVDFLPDYLSHLKSMVDLSAIGSFTKNPKNTANALIDSMGGAGQTVIEDILVGCGWRAQTLFSAPEDRFFDRRPESVSENLYALKYNVKVIDAQFGVATDGNGARCGLVYDDGEWMNMQDTALALLWHLHEQKHWQGNILKTAYMTDRVKRLSDLWNVPLFDVGLGNGIEEMLKGECLFGAMERGGFCYGRHLPECDGILSGLFFAEMIAKAEKPLRQILQQIHNAVGQVHYKSIDINCEMVSAMKVLSTIAKFPPKPFVDMNVHDMQKYEQDGTISGIKFTWGECLWLLIQPLAVESIIRLHAEGESEEDVTAILAIGKKYFEL